MALLRKNELSMDISNADNHAVLGAGAEFSGKLSFRGSVRIDGVFSGEITTDGVLVIGCGARVEATMETGSLVVNGSFNGTVVASEAVELKKTARFYGNISAPSLVIEQGAIYEGTCKMAREPNEEMTNGNQPMVEVLDHISYQA